MKIGVTGHQRREGIDWRWVREALRSELSCLSEPISAYGSLAEGADQIFAEVALEYGADVYALIPKDDYIKHYQGPAKTHYLALLSKSNPIHLSLSCPDEEAFLAAGQRVVNSVDRMYAIWDGKPAHGKGGTADIVVYAQKKGVPVVHLDPINRTISHL